MLRRVDREAPRETHAREDPSLRETGQVVAPALDVDLDAWSLPRDHPKWVKDAITISNRARELLARLKPVVVTILSFWDHRIRSTLVGGSRLSIDPTGSYRVD